MKKATTLFVFILSFQLCHAQMDSIGSPVVWLRADKSELTSTSWKDVSFFRNNAASLSTNGAPSSGGLINFNKAILFDGIDDYLKVSYSLESLADVSVMTVFQSADTTERGIWGAEQSKRIQFLTTRQAMGPDTLPDRYGSGERIAVLNSVLQNWEGKPTVPGTSFFAIGSAGSAHAFKPFKGTLAEVIVFDRSLTFLDRIKYETYLALKYGTGMRAGNYISSNDNVLWKVKENAAYGRNIAGIGRDDYFNLAQKQSGSAYDSALLFIAAGTLKKTNDENLATIADQDFIVWGDNGKPLTSVRGTGVDSVLSVVQRKWLVSASGQTASNLATELSIDAARLPANLLGYWLIIDRSGSGDFSVDNVEYIFPDRNVNGKIIYKVKWDTDRSGKDNFTFAQAAELFAVVRKVNDPSCTDENAGRVNIEVIAGKAPYRFALTSPAGNIKREWRQSEKSAEQKELVAGSYALVVSDANREELDRKFSMTMPDALTFSAGPDRTYSPTADIFLDVSEQIPDSIEVTYRWENSFGFNSTDKKIKVNESGIYKVFVTKKSDGCVFSDEVTVFGGETLRIAVYPTLLRSNDPYNVSVSLQEPGSVYVRVFNARGIEISSMQGNGSTEYQFSTSLKESGIYLVVIQTPKGSETRKVVVQ